MRRTFFIAGFQKCASTWLHRCLQTHPQVFMPDLHMLHYFDIQYLRGREWYESLFAAAESGQVCGDATVTYARSDTALRRIQKDLSDPRIILLLRNPIERAWSHYWHERKKQKIQFEFHEWQENYDLYADWIEPGLYDERLQACDQIFSPEQVLTLFYDDILTTPENVMAEACTHIGVDSDFVPDALHKKVNTTVIPPGRSLIGRLFSSRDMTHDYQSGPDHVQHDALANVFRPSIQYLEQRFGRDLSRWLEFDR